MSSLSLIDSTDLVDIHRENYLQLNEGAGICSNKLLVGLNNFIHMYAHQNRSDLLPGRHWFWYSVRNKMKRITVLMILNGHLINMNDLKIKK